MSGYYTKGIAIFVLLCMVTASLGELLNFLQASQQRILFNIHYYCNRQLTQARSSSTLGTSPVEHQDSDWV